MKCVVCEGKYDRIFLQEYIRKNSNSAYPPIPEEFRYDLKYFHDSGSLPRLTPHSSSRRRTDKRSISLYP